MAALENTFMGRPGMSKTRCRTPFSARSALNSFKFPSTVMAFLREKCRQYSILYICVLVEPSVFANRRKDGCYRRCMP